MGLLARESCNFVAIAANSHGAPAPLVGSRVVGEEKAALGIGAEAKPGTVPLSDDLRSGAGHGGEKPVEATFTSDKLNFPLAVPADQFIVSFGNPKNFVERLNPIGSNLLFAEHGSEDPAESGSQALGLEK